MPSFPNVLGRDTGRWHVVELLARLLWDFSNLGRAYPLLCRTQTENFSVLFRWTRTNSGTLWNLQGEGGRGVKHKIVSPGSRHVPPAVLNARLESSMLLQCAK